MEVLTQQHAMHMMRSSSSGIGIILSKPFSPAQRTAGTAGTAGRRQRDGGWKSAQGFGSAARGAPLRVAVGHGWKGPLSPLPLAPVAPVAPARATPGAANGDFRQHIRETAKNVLAPSPATAGPSTFTTTWVSVTIVAGASAMMTRVECVSAVKQVPEPLDA